MMASLRRYAVKVDGALNRVVKFSAAISSVIIFVMMFMITADVIMRYVFNSPIQGTFELSEFCLVWIVFLSIAYIQSHKGHIKIDIATSWMPMKGQMILDIFSYFLGIAFFAIVFWQSGKMAWNAWVIKDHTMGLVEFPLWPAKFLVPYGAGLICLQFLSNIVQDISRILSPAIDGIEKKGQI
jgi:TRAP-type C4-dicarboxylate transport system permease small subunit